jgi:hypothetical protein
VKEANAYRHVANRIATLRWSCWLTDGGQQKQSSKVTWPAARSHAAWIRFGHSDAVPRVTVVSQLQTLSNVQCPAASGQSTKSLRDSGEVGLVLSASPKDEIVGSGGSRLS